MTVRVDGIDSDLEQVTVDLKPDNLKVTHRAAKTKNDR